MTTKVDKILFYLNANNNSNKKIAISGAQGTGKTTLLYALAEKIKMNYPKKNLGIISELARESPFTRNKEATFDGQLWLFNKQIMSELEKARVNDFVLSDRSIIDILAYTYNLIPPAQSMNMMWNFAMSYVYTYDLIVVNKIKNNDFLFSDGVRDINEHYRETIENLIFYFINKISFDNEEKLEIVYL